MGQESGRDFLWFSVQGPTRPQSGVGWDCGLNWGSESSSRFTLLLGEFIHDSVFLQGQQENLCDLGGGPSLSFKELAWLGQAHQGTLLLKNSVTWLGTLIASEKALHLCHITSHNIITGVISPYVHSSAFSKVESACHRQMAGIHIPVLLLFLHVVDCMCDPLNPYVEALTPNVMVVGAGTFGRWLVLVRWGHEGGALVMGLAPW